MSLGSVKCVEVESTVGALSHLLRFACCIGTGAGRAFHLHDLGAGGALIKAGSPVKGG